MFIFKKDTSRLKKKLLLYFLLISIVAVSVSAEIILEFSSPRFRNLMEESFYGELLSKELMNKEIIDLNKQYLKEEKDNNKNQKNNKNKVIAEKTLKILRNKSERKNIFVPISDYRDRMILLLLVVFGSIMGAFFLFTKDIVDPMDGMVAATQKIADGDLTVKVPVMTEDEIGQIGSLINNMNEKLLDMIVQVKQDLNRHKDKIDAAASIINEMIYAEKTDDIIETKKMRVGDFKRMVKLSKDVVSLLDIMTADLSSLQTFINMYKTYSLKTELTQDEIEDAIKNYKSDLWF